MRRIIVLFMMLYSIDASGKAFIDTVYSFTPGTVQFSGQSEEFFPMNIFGAPSISASRFVQASAESDVCSIGIGGEIVVGVKSGKVYNGEGPDFIIFENAFERQFDSVVFAEPAVVSVSQNGIDFIEFPFNEWTLEGLAGKTPVNGSADSFDYLASGGDAFDLSDLGLDYITHIKIRDTSRIITKDELHPFYQPEFIVTGFDLDAISILYPNQTTYIEDELQSDFVLRDLSDCITVETDSNFEVRLYNTLGIEILSVSADSFISIDKLILPKGLLIIRIEKSGKTYTRKITR